MTWTGRFLLSGAILFLVTLLALMGGREPGEQISAAELASRQPHLLIGDSVGSDLEDLAFETWKRFLSVFSARSDCFGDLRLEAVRGLESRAKYDPETGTATVRVPGTRAMLQGALVHEWAHHLEFQCDDHHQLRPAFFQAQNLPDGAAWRPDDWTVEMPSSRWAEIPSEQFAETCIVLVLGHRHIPTKILVSPEAVQVVQTWANGDHPSAVRGE